MFYTVDKQTTSAQKVHRIFCGKPDERIFGGKSTHMMGEPSRDSQRKPKWRKLPRHVVVQSDYMIHQSQSNITLHENQMIRINVSYV